MNKLEEIKLAIRHNQQVDINWLVSKVEQYEAVLNCLLTKNDWLSVEEVEEYIRENLK